MLVKGCGCLSGEGVGGGGGGGGVCCDPLMNYDEIICFEIWIWLCSIRMLAHFIF